MVLVEAPIVRKFMILFRGSRVLVFVRLQRSNQLLRLKRQTSQLIWVLTAPWRLEGNPGMNPGEYHAGLSRDFQKDSYIPYEAQ